MLIFLLQLILIAHSDQETPIYIALPDFDWKTMSSVLYYIYNGEISVPIGNITSFFEIINTLKIFINENDLENVKEYLKCNFEENKLDCKVNINSSNEELNSPVKLEFKSTKCTSPTILNENRNDLQCTVDGFPKENCNEYLNKISKENKTILKNSSLRDHFTKMCSRNGNLNRPSANVPTITNECYLQFVSGEEMNGNKDVLNVSPEYKSNCTVSKKIVNDSHVDNCYVNDSEINLDMSTYDTVIDTLNHDKAKELRPVPILIPINTTMDSIDLSKHYQLKHNQTCVNSCRRAKVYEQSKTCSNKKILCVERKNSFKTKRSPLNQVLANPWITRQPRSYRPLKKKRRTSIEIRNEQVKMYFKLYK